jgi:hypothetical protein
MRVVAGERIDILFPCYNDGSPIETKTATATADCSINSTDLPFSSVNEDIEDVGSHRDDVAVYRVLDGQNAPAKNSWLN